LSVLRYAAWLRLDARQLRYSRLTAQRSPFSSAMAWLIAFRAVKNGKTIRYQLLYDGEVMENILFTAVGDALVKVSLVLGQGLLTSLRARSSQASRGLRFSK
jgi:hypothetical protein